MKKLLFWIGSLWLLGITLSFFWNYNQLAKERERIALETGRSIFEFMLISRAWNARHGGVYVPVTGETLPNPYLEAPLRDIEVNENLKLTMVNPAYMTRQLSELALEQDDIQFHITSLNPIRPENSPDAIEASCLKAFEQGLKEAVVFREEGEAGSLFYMAPLITEKACLSCHAEQGYQEGDIRGGLSITLPFTMKVPFSALAMGHVVIGLAGLAGISILGVKLGRAYATIEHQAVMDALTGIPNHRSFMETIPRELKRSYRSKEPVSIIMCDIDHFKKFNDTYGHQAGDACLRKVAQAIAGSLKRPGDFCARYGGEEFVMVLPHTPRPAAMQVAERIRLKVQGLTISHETSLPLSMLTISLGVATAADGSLVSHDELMQQADRALYKAKEHGRNRVESWNLEDGAMAGEPASVNT